ncbi:MAG: DNA alkylation repair protein [Lentimicrobium sp.]|nr:DNA alkylation repair protein [Lentimicrobium sp.]
MNQTDYASALQAHFALNSNAEYAGRMSKYMLNKFEFFGIPSPQRKQLTTQFIQLNGLPAAEQLDETVRLVWQLPQRELHYAIMEIAARKANLDDEERINLYRYMITNKSWWDTVDYIASNLAGAWLAKHKQMTGKVTGEFMQSGDMWLQRTALLFQLKYKGNTDHELLFRYIREVSSSKEFFIRKAIGWALRELSKTNPKLVLNFTNSIELSNLSRREALKIILKKSADE